MKVGDFVELLKNEGPKKGTIGKVVAIQGTIISVDWANWKYGHSCEHKARYVHGWRVHGPDVRVLKVNERKLINIWLKDFKEHPEG